MPTPGPGELIIILVIFVLLFGAKKLPDLGSSVGKSIKNFKKGINEGAEEDADADAEAPRAETEVPTGTQTSRDL